MNEHTIGERHLPAVIERETCRKHDADHGMPCWAFVADSGRVITAVCNRRAKRAGFVGHITPSSLRKK